MRGAVCDNGVGRPGVERRTARPYRPLGDDSFEVTFAGKLEEPAAAALDRFEKHQARLDPGHDEREPALALDLRQAAQILSVE